jgi:hypothetical protein
MPSEAETRWLREVRRGTPRSLGRAWASSCRLAGEFLDAARRCHAFGWDEEADMNLRWAVGQIAIARALWRALRDLHRREVCDG